MVSAAVCLKDTSFVNRIADSKKLSQRMREKAFHEIFERAWVGVGIMNERVIDEVNILNATHLAMTQAIKDLWGRMKAEAFSEAGDNSLVRVIVDGNSYRGSIPFAVQCVVAGDAKSLCIACASIVAKVTRDRLMEQYDKAYPQYGFLKHKGYPTREHRQAVKAFGLSPIHRRTFTVSFS